MNCAQRYIPSLSQLRDRTQGQGILIGTNWFLSKRSLSPGTEQWCYVRSVLGKKCGVTIYIANGLEYSYRNKRTNLGKSFIRTRLASIFNLPFAPFANVMTVWVEIRIPSTTRACYQSARNFFLSLCLQYYIRRVEA